jgi:polysaccharide biosynthesis protein PslJ
MSSFISDPVADSVESLELLVADERKQGTGAVALLTFYLFLLMAIPADLVFGPMGAAGGPATIFALLVLVIYLGMWLRPASPLDRGVQPIRRVGILFTCSIVASYVWANRHLMPVLEKNAADRGLIFVLGWLGILLLAADGIESGTALRTILRRLVFGSTAVALIGMAEFASGIVVTNYVKIPGLQLQADVTDLMVRGGLSRVYSTTSQPIEFGAVVVMAIPFALHFARFAPPGLRVRRWLQVGILVMAAPLSVSRSAILALLVAAIVLLPTWSRRERHITYGLMAAGFAGFLVVVPSLITTLADLVVNIGSDPSAQSRTKAIAMSWSYISQSPLLGRGFGTFQPDTYFFVDDQYLTSLIVTGVVGLLALIMLFAAGWLIARSARRMIADPEGRHLAQCLAASIAVAAISFSNYDALSFSMASGILFLLLGCCGAFWRFAKRGDLQA